MNLKTLLIPIIAMIIAQIIKILIDAIKGESVLKDLSRYGGMPSGHAALVGALAMEVGMAEGFYSATFAIAFVLAFLIARDAVGIRYRLGKHGEVLNKLIKDDKKFKPKPPRLEDRLGHTPAQVIVGLLLGIAIAILI